MSFWIIPTILFGLWAKDMGQYYKSFSPIEWGIFIFLLVGFSFCLWKATKKIIKNLITD